MPLETIAERSTRLASQELAISINGCDPRRPFTLKNLDVPGKFSGKGAPVATPWLAKMSYWIHLSKVLDSDLWDVLATRMSGEALTWMNTKLNAKKPLGSVPWPEWQAFVRAFKAQFEPMSREERAHEQIRKLN